VPAINLQAQGFGSQNPIADNSTEAGRTRNRRVTLHVS
jgi:outer membrane protein OmpA-like peptidoglycan-associated protein